MTINKFIIILGVLCCISIIPTFSQCIDVISPDSDSESAYSYETRKNIKQAQEDQKEAENEASKADEAAAAAAAAEPKAEAAAENERKNKGKSPMSDEEKKQFIAAFTTDFTAKFMANLKKAYEDNKALHPPPDFVKVTLKSSTFFKLSVDNDVDSGFTKSQDYVQFSVAQDVYANNADETERCVVIPKDTKVYGIVYRSKGRHPFRIGGKAVLIVYVNKISLDIGKEINISFSPPEDIVKCKSKARDSKIFEVCENGSNKQCISGRLTRSVFSPSIIGSGAQGLIGFEDGKTLKSVAVLTLLQDLSNASGLSDLINQSNAALKQKQIFDVKTSDDLTMWVTLSKKMDGSVKTDKSATDAKKDTPDNKSGQTPRN